MKLTVLMDNCTYIDQYYLGEPAVSYYIETDGMKILFDTGYSDAFLLNAKAMGIDLSHVTHILLSHGHNDHSRGLQYFHQAFPMSKATLLCHPDCFQPRWEQGQSIGAPFSEEEAAHLFRYSPSRSPVFLSDDCCFLGEIPCLHSFETRRPIGRIQRDTDLADDPVLDDTALACRTKEGLFIITGCSHSGICNIVSYAQKLMGMQKIAAIIGGFHLLAKNQRLADTIAFLKSQPIHTLYPCHCVSLQAKADMMDGLPVEEVGVGLSVKVP